jgi:hypothetical protein
VKAQECRIEKKEGEVESALGGLERELKGASNIVGELIARLDGVLSPQNPTSEMACVAEYRTELSRLIGEKTQTVLSISERLKGALERLEI